MKLRCLNEKCGKTFLYAAKQEIAKVGDEDTNETLVTETHVCPYCGSKDIDEFVEPQPEISSLKKAALEEVDGLIAQGYVVHSVFANHAVLVKREEKKLE